MVFSVKIILTKDNGVSACMYVFFVCCVHVCVFCVVCACVPFSCIVFVLPVHVYCVCARTHVCDLLTFKSTSMSFV